MRKLPATIVTGFLGAGKTSLIRHLLQHAEGRRIALVINEFGELGIDREILLGCGVASCGDEDVIELANGCLCCTVAEDFLPTIERLLARPDPPEHIVIETSGLALPKPLVQAFAWPEVRARATVDGVVAVIDAAALAEGKFADDPAALAAQRAADPALDHDNPLEEVFGDQLASADLVLLNKTDLLAPSTLDAVEAALRDRLRPAVKLLRSQGGAVPPGLLLGLAAAAEEDLANRPSHHDLDGAHDHEDFESFVVARGPVADPERFLHRIGAVLAAHDVLRLKGFLDIPGKEFRQVVQAVGARLQHYFDRPWRAGEARATRLVVIGRKGLDRTAITAALAV
ncbi:MAG TPA: cobalamin biosynthesis protein CobW [Stellaceae bacterium]|nr:cobalamin biosynthesis protein CobW [Stellaceae bacterium]